MYVFDVSHRARMKIQPFLAKNCVPAPANQKVDNDQDPDGEVIDLRFHEGLRIIQVLEVRLQVDFSDRAPSNPHPPLSLAKGEATLLHY